MRVQIMNNNRTSRLLAIVLLALPSVACGFASPVALQVPTAQDAPSSAAEKWSLVNDDWMILEIGGSRVGWMNTLVERSGELFRTHTATEMSISRGEVSVAIKMTSTFIETADGKPVSVVSVQDMASQATETRWEFAGDKIKQLVKSGGRETASELNAPAGEWFTPHKADEYSNSQRKAGAKEISFRTLDPQNGVKPVTSTSKYSGESEYEINGSKTKVQVWKSTTDLMPIEATEYLDAEGEVVFQEIPSGMGKIVMRTATKEQATAKAGAGDGAPELMVKTFAKPDKPIKDSLKTTTAKLKLTAREGTLPAMPSAGAQRVEVSADGKTAILTIDINDPLPASEAEKINDEFTRPSTMVDYNDALVTKLAERANDEADALTKADALRKIVNKHISKKNMATAFASASETARTRTGDCSEHGVLLAALLRADGIPSRTAMGLVYAPEFMGEEGIFGWHMWTQALIDGKWIDLDATLPVRYSAAHILTNTSSMADGMGASDMASILQLIGNIDVEVLDVGYDRD